MDLEKSQSLACTRTHENCLCSVQFCRTVKAHTGITWSVADSHHDHIACCALNREIDLRQSILVK